MDEDQLSLRQADQIRGDLYGIHDDLDFIKVQLARLPTRSEVFWITVRLTVGTVAFIGPSCAIRPVRGSRGPVRRRRRP